MMVIRGERKKKNWITKIDKGEKIYFSSFWGGEKNTYSRGDNQSRRQSTPPGRARAHGFLGVTKKTWKYLSPHLGIKGRNQHNRVNASTSFRLGQGGGPMTLRSDRVRRAGGRDLSSMGCGIFVKKKKILEKAE